MRRPLVDRLNTALDRVLPEQRLFLRSDDATRYLRLSPLTQLGMMGGAVLVVGWAVFSTAVLMTDSLGSGNLRAQSEREQRIYEERLNAMAQERDVRAVEAAAAQERFNTALSEVSQMQSALLSSEDERRELQTGMEVVQTTLRRVMGERDLARSQLAEAQAEASGEERLVSDAGRTEDLSVTLDALTESLAEVAGERDAATQAAELAEAELNALEIESRLHREHTDEIFGQLEDAVAISIEPLDDIFRAAGLSPTSVLDTVRRGYSGQGGPLTPLTLSKSSYAGDEDERAGDILDTLDRLNLYRIAIEKTPFAMPVQSSYRLSSPFGYRRDPKGAGRRLHSGTDFAAAHGTPIYATADGVVTFAGWGNGYGRLIKIKHDFGIETRYAHMSRLRVSVGQRVSRGQRIGDMGNTGRSTGTHLHYELRINGTAVDPMRYIRAARNVF